MYHSLHLWCKWSLKKAQRKLLLIVGLEAHSDYDIRVLAGTKAGYPDLDDSEWPWATGTTGVPDVEFSK